MLSYSEAIGRVASAQFGLITAAQLREVGLSYSAVYRMTRAGALERLQFGVYRVAGTPVSWRGRVAGAALMAGPTAVLSHSTAGVLWGWMSRHDVVGIDITDVKQVRIPGVISHITVLDARDRTTRYGIPVTSVERTLIDLSARVAPDQIGCWLDDAIRSRHTTVGRMAAAVDRLSLRAPVSRSGIRSVLADRGVGWDPGANDWERAMDDFWEAAGLPPAERQYRIDLPGGRWFVPDRVIPDARMTIDWNGRAWHGTRSRFDRDSDRRNLLLQDNWCPLDFTTNTPLALVRETVLAVYQRRITELRSAS